MKRYAIFIAPQGALGTPLKGDTLFGHFCWQAAHDPSLLEGGLDAQIQKYEERPFAVFSSAFPSTGPEAGSFFLKRPSLPSRWLFAKESLTPREQLRRRKELQEREWVEVKLDLRLDLLSAQYLTGEDVAERISPPEVEEEAVRLSTSYEQPHNTIHRITGTTGKGEFAPFSKRNIFYRPGTRLAILVDLDEEATDIQRVMEGMARIGRWGFGRDASAGLGRFVVEEEFAPLPTPSFDAGSACYTLAPCVPQAQTFQHMYFTPFVRFGKHGDRLASSRYPFKRPVIMADEGAVLIPKEPALLGDRSYIGQAVGNVSKIEPGAQVQGYAPCLPMPWEVRHEA